jgi:hypothetical protein
VYSNWSTVLTKGFVDPVTSGDEFIGSNVETLDARENIDALETLNWGMISASNAIAYAVVQASYVYDLARKYTMYRMSALTGNAGDASAMGENS